MEELYRTLENISGNDGFAASRMSRKILAEARREQSDKFYYYLLGNLAQRESRKLVFEWYSDNRGNFTPKLVLEKMADEFHDRDIRDVAEKYQRKINGGKR